MDECAETVVRLKYDIITCDSSTWRYSSQYPPKVLSKWAWRCAEDVEHIANTNYLGNWAYVYARGFMAGKISKITLMSLCVDFALLTDAEYCAAISAIYAASRSHPIEDVHHAVLAKSPITRDNIEAYKLTWNLYIGWLIEELVRYESR